MLVHINTSVPRRHATRTRVCKVTPRRQTLDKEQANHEPHAQWLQYNEKAKWVGKQSRGRPRKYITRSQQCPIQPFHSTIMNKEVPSGLVAHKCKS